MFLYAYDSPNHMITRAPMLAKGEPEWNTHHQQLIICRLFETANYRKQLIKKQSAGVKRNARKKLSDFGIGPDDL